MRESQSTQQVVLLEMVVPAAQVVLERRVVLEVPTLSVLQDNSVTDCSGLGDSFNFRATGAFRGVRRSLEISQ
jgi:hypothetical protein